MRRTWIAVAALTGIATLGATMGVSSALAAEQTVTFTQKPPPTALVGEAVPVEAEASSKLPVTIRSTGEACEVTEVVIAPQAKAKVNFRRAGSCVVEAVQGGDLTFAAAKAEEPVSVAKKPQSVAFTLKLAASPTVGESATVAAEASSKHEVTVRAATPACQLSGTTQGVKPEPTVQFTHAGTCTLEAEAGDLENATAKTEESVLVAKGAQTINFASRPPTSATVGGAYGVSAIASSGLPVAFGADPSAAGVCSVFGSNVSFIGPGTCKIDATQPGNNDYEAAPQATQSFTVAAAPVVTVVPGPAPSPTPSPAPTSGNSNFRAGQSSFEPKTGRVIFFETITDPGTFKWLLTVPNGKFGVFASSRKCNAGLVRLSGRCRPSRVIFATGTASVPAGVVIFKLRPSPNALKALRNALRRSRGVLVTATFTFQSSRGGSPVTHTQTLRVKLKR
ncbi:MAG TPA: hypothetical protein VGO14_06865 [Solirubrobacteraceae bacterium]|jgi:hypothetical protein|nr:hypothetical protein [Solirubrobacteraceae bacterium]